MSLPTPLSSPAPADAPATSCTGASAQDGSQWFSEEIQPHETHLRRYLHGAFPSVRDVDDVIQESYVRMWKARSSRQVRSVRRFLFKVARNVALDTLSRLRNSPIIEVGNLDQLPVTEESAAAAGAMTDEEKLAVLADALVILPPRCREIVMLRKLRGVSRGDVALRLGLSEKTVDEHLARGVKRLEDHVRRNCLKRL